MSVRKRHVVDAALVLFLLIAAGVVWFSETEGAWRLAGLGFLAALGIALAVWKLPNWQFEAEKIKDGAGELERKDYLTAKNSARAAVAQILVGLFGLATIAATWQQLENGRTTSERTFRQAEQRARSDQFNDAIDKTGDSNVRVQIGGIYILEQLAQTAPTDYLPRVVDLLATYVRQSQPRQAAAVTVGAPAVDPAPARPPEDIRAAMAVLGGRPRDGDGAGAVTLANGAFRSLTCIDLSETTLRGLAAEGSNLAGICFVHTDLTAARLTDAVLTGSSFARADLGAAVLTGAHGEDVDFTQATLLNADLSGASLPGASFSQAVLTDATLHAAILPGAVFRSAVLAGADLGAVDLQDAQLQLAALTGADLRGAKLAGANLQLASLTDADLTDADLQRANLRSANLLDTTLTGADLRGADLTGARLEGANLGGADLSTAIGLTQEQLCTATADATTLLPAGLQPCASTA